jgi:hypothetical protein
MVYVTGGRRPSSHATACVRRIDEISCHPLYPPETLKLLEWKCPRTATSSRSLVVGAGSSQKRVSHSISLRSRRRARKFHRRRQHCRRDFMHSPDNNSEIREGDSIRPDGCRASILSSAHHDQLAVFEFVVCNGVRDVFKHVPEIRNVFGRSLNAATQPRGQPEFWRFSCFSAT